MRSIVAGGSAVGAMKKMSFWKPRKIVGRLLSPLVLLSVLPLGAVAIATSLIAPAQAEVDNRTIADVGDASASTRARANACGVPGFDGPERLHAPPPGSFCSIPPLPQTLDGPSTDLESQSGTDVAPMSSGDWSVVSSPNASNQQASNAFQSTTCVSASDCWAVGAVLSNDRYRTLTARWDGTSWSVVPSPNIPGKRYNVLYGISCPAPSDCWAVGFSGAGLSSATWRTLTLHWDGASWAVVESPNASSTSVNVLFGVICVSISDCWAVGYYQAEIGGWTANLIEHWDGASWNVVPSPNGEKHNGLNSVTCISTSDCWAVGSFGAGRVSRTMTQRWDGTTWTIVPSPNASVTNNTLNGVTCASPSDCWAVGLSIPDNEANENPNPPNWLTLIQHWDGESWRIVESPNGTSTLRNHLASVACTSASDCWAVGSYQVGTNVGQPDVQTLILRWVGTTWTVVSSPNGGSLSHFLGVTCLPSSDCWAVGGHGNPAHTLATRWDGAGWTTIATPTVGVPQDNRLTDVTCVSRSSCWAVGHYDTGDVEETAILWWNGVWWRTVTAPNVGSPWSSVLSGVACTSSSNCWAVGHSHFEGHVARTLIHHWNGSSWGIVESPNRLALRNLLTDIACVSASQCWAVGYSDDGLARQSLVLRWDGTSWSVVSSPDSAPEGDGWLEAIACISESDCWAVGGQGGDDEKRSFIVHWDGISWAVVSSPNTSATESNVLRGVACVSASDCWAVGSYHDGSEEHTLAQRWDGSSWALVSSPNTDTSEENVLNAVACASASDCWAIGTRRGEGAEQTLVQRWDGTSWQIAASPNATVDRANILTGITCLPASDCWAVGSYLDITACLPSASQCAPDPTRTTDQTLVLTREGSDERVETFLELTLEGHGSKMLLRARLSERDGRAVPIVGRTISFYAESQFIGSSVTDQDGVAAISVPPRYRGGHSTFEALFEGDDIYGRSSASTEPRHGAL